MPDFVLAHFNLADAAEVRDRACGGLEGLVGARTVRVQVLIRRAAALRDLAVHSQDK